MNIDEILTSIDAEIARLEEAKRLLEGGDGVGIKKSKPGPNAGKRKLSSEARAKTAAAQKARWAKEKKAAK
jgi:hypothetical protein